MYWIWASSVTGLCDSFMTSDICDAVPPCITLDKCTPCLPIFLPIHTLQSVDDPCQPLVLTFRIDKQNVSTFLCTAYSLIAAYLPISTQISDERRLENGWTPLSIDGMEERIGKIPSRLFWPDPVGWTTPRIVCHNLKRLQACEKHIV